MAVCFVFMLKLGSIIWLPQAADNCWIHTYVILWLAKKEDNVGKSWWQRYSNKKHVYSTDELTVGTAGLGMSCLYLMQRMVMSFSRESARWQFMSSIYGRTTGSWYCRQVGSVWKCGHKSVNIDTKLFDSPLMSVLCVRRMCKRQQLCIGLCVVCAETWSVLSLAWSVQLSDDSLLTASRSVSLCILYLMWCPRLVECTAATTFPDWGS